MKATHCFFFLFCFFFFFKEYNIKKIVLRKCGKGGIFKFSIWRNTIILSKIYITPSPEVNVALDELVALGFKPHRILPAVFRILFILIRIRILGCVSSNNKSRSFFGSDLKSTFWFMKRIRIQKPGMNGSNWIRIRNTASLCVSGADSKLVLNRESHNVDFPIPVSPRHRCQIGVLDIT